MVYLDAGFAALNAAPAIAGGNGVPYALWDATRPLAITTRQQRCDPVRRNPHDISIGHLETLHGHQSRAALNVDRMFAP